MCIGNAISKGSLRRFKPARCEVCDAEVLANGEENGCLQEDTLPTVTYYTKVILFSCGGLYKGFEESKLYKILCSTMQPAHLITLLAVSAVACLTSSTPCKPSPFLNLLYLGSVSAHFGAQLWMSFVSGLSLYFSLPRRTFGKVQKILFPKYFLINSVLSLISLCVFLNNNNNKLMIPQMSLQFGTLTLCFSIELIVCLYLTPPLLRLMERASQFEEAVGVGMEIGKHDAGPLKSNEQYLTTYRSFRKIHTVIAVGNIITMGCSVLHLHYLSTKLIEVWKPGISALRCPACSKRGRPLVRKHKTKIAQTSLGALCLMGCWPVCFFPLILAGSNIMDLYCHFCGQQLGSYDRRTGSFIADGNSDMTSSGYYASPQSRRFFSDSSRRNRKLSDGSNRENSPSK